MKQVILIGLLSLCDQIACVKRTACLIVIRYHTRSYAIIGCFLLLAIMFLPKFVSASPCALSGAKRLRLPGCWRATSPWWHFLWHQTLMSSLFSYRRILSLSVSFVRFEPLKKSRREDVWNNLEKKRGHETMVSCWFYYRLQSIQFTSWSWCSFWFVMLFEMSGSP